MLVGPLAGTAWMLKKGVKTNFCKQFANKMLNGGSRREGPLWVKSGHIPPVIAYASNSPIFAKCPWLPERQFHDICSELHTNVLLLNRIVLS